MGHYLKANKGNETPSTFIFFDTETSAIPIPEKSGRYFHRFRLGFASSFRLEGARKTRRKEIDFTDPVYFWNWVIGHLSKHRPVWMFAHNVGFDLTTTLAWQLMEDEVFRVKRYVSDDPPTIIQLEHDLGKLVIVDSLNWLRTSLAKIAESMKMAKYEVDFASCSEEELWKHCRQDVRILEERIYTLLIWLRENNLGVMQKTAPSQSLQCYRHRFAPSTVVKRERIDKSGMVKREAVKVCYPLMHENPEIAAKERRAYFGGEARCFWIGKILDTDDLGTVAIAGTKGLPKQTKMGPIYHLDVNSLYPYVMKEFKYPCKYLYTLERPELKIVEQGLETGEVIASVLLQSPIQTFPLRVIDTPSYVCGKFWTVLCGNELRYALRCGFVKSISEALFYEVRDMFSSFVDYFWTLRAKYQAEGNTSQEKLCKLMMNSLYGKFGSRAYKWVDRANKNAAIPWGQWVEEEPWGGHHTTYRAIAWHTQEKQDGGEAKDSFVAIPACVCANARQYMREIRILSGERNVLYQHTDSLHVTPEGYSILGRRKQLSGTDLGKLKLVEVIKHGEYRGINNYSANGRDVIAGVNTSNGRNPDGSIEYLKFANLATIAASKPPEGVVVTETSYRFPRVNPGDSWDDTGWVNPKRIG